MKTYRYRLVEVFTEKRLEGNPLAVFQEASGLEDATMHRIANELNLAETVFAFPATGNAGRFEPRPDVARPFVDSVWNGCDRRRLARCESASSLFPISS
jgi:hypothetical protein